MTRTIRLTGRTAAGTPPEPTRMDCDACGAPTHGKWVVRMEDGAWYCQDCLTDNQRIVWLKIFKDAKE